MGTIVFNAFSFLQKKLKDRNIPCVDAPVTVSEGQTVMDILKAMTLDVEDIECVFLNGKIADTGTTLKDGDRLAALPPGTPGPYRLLLGIVNNRRAQTETAHDED
ncbi:MAG TPA: MoaD/ThiS family protein [Syntrophales bacterium]|nr:MoaD/ThiS family protein [Syntrophales bacterium]